MTDDLLDVDEAELRALVDGADHDSVTVDLLGGGDEYGGLSLYDEPPAAYLQRGEQPHHAFFNEMKGIGVGDKRDTVAPDGSGLTVALITDRRTLALVGQSDGDELFEVPHERVRGVDYSTGIMKHRLVVTTPGTTYHLWVDASYDEADLSAAADALREYREAAREEGRTTVAGATTSDGGAAGETRPSAATSGNDPADAESGAGDEEDPLDTLERLEELRDRGVITDEEFEEKKADLLDQI